MNIPTLNHVAAFNDLFITLRKKFICQLKDGSYVTRSTSDPHPVKLTDNYIINHLNQCKTIGIYVNEITKFMVFDIDSTYLEDAQELHDMICAELINIGINGQYIHTEYSGRKGYHIWVFFETPKNVRAINTLQAIIVNRVKKNHHYNPSLGNIEIRPTNTQGIKLPMGKHRSMNRICWFCDDEFKPIESYDYIYTIQKLPDRDLNYIFQKIKYENSINFELSKILKEIRGNGSGISQERYEAGKEAYQSGILFPGTRHESLLNAALYLKSCGFCEEKCHEKLTKWMSEQDPDIITTPKSKWQSDVDQVVSDVYKFKAPSEGKGKIDLSVTREIMHYIYSNAHTRCERLILFLLVLNQIRFKYHLEDGGFRFSEKQITDATLVSRDTAIRAAKALSEKGIITMQTGKPSDNPIVKCASLFGKPPTWYKVNNDLLYLIQRIPSSDYKTEITFSEPLYEQMNYAMLRHSGIDELRQYLGRDALRAALSDYQYYLKSKGLSA